MSVNERPLLAESRRSAPEPLWRSVHNGGLPEEKTMTENSLALVVVILLAVSWSVSSAQIHDPRAIQADPTSDPGPIAPTLRGLGEYHVPITTDSEASQSFFDQGLRLTYAFNHSEALRAFKEAARLDPDNAMAHWGWALVLGPNLNLSMQPEVVPQAYAAIQKAVSLKNRVSAKERQMIEALAQRYTDDPDVLAFDKAYADAMGSLSAAYPEDLDIVTLYAASLMNLSTWDYWYLDGTPKANTVTLVSALESVIAREPNHPGALHYYIHAVEEHHPERAEASADRLGALMPGAGHMVHMPSHIYMRLGRYVDSYDANILASQADEDYITQCRAQGLYPLSYYPHNVHFLTWSAMFMGRQAAALEASRKVADNVPADFGTDAWGAYQTFLGQPLYTMVRFGMWEEILAEPPPTEAARFLTAVWHYARGLAYINTEERRRANAELRRLQAVRGDETTAEQSIGYNAMPTLIAIAEEILSGEIDAKSGRFDEAISHLERGVRLENTLRYNEPPDWYFPVRHYLGAVLLEAGFPAEAEVVYWEDLRKNRENGYALFGLQQALEAQGKTAQAIDVEARFEVAWATADTGLISSRF